MDLRQRTTTVLREVEVALQELRQVESHLASSRPGAPLVVTSDLGKAASELHRIHDQLDAIRRQLWGIRTALGQ